MNAGIPKIAAIVLAAGASSRMGANKLLLHSISPVTGIFEAICGNARPALH